MIPILCGGNRIVVEHLYPPVCDKTVNGVHIVSDGIGHLSLTGTCTCTEPLYPSLGSVKIPYHVGGVLSNNVDNAHNPYFSLRSPSNLLILAFSSVKKIDLDTNDIFILQFNGFLKNGVTYNLNNTIDFTYTYTDYDQNTLLPTTASYKNTTNGITVKSNGSGGYTVKGTATASTWFTLKSITSDDYDDFQNYIFNSFTKAGVEGTYDVKKYRFYLDFKKNGTYVKGENVRGSGSINSSFDQITFYIYVANGVTVDDVLYPRAVLYSNPLQKTIEDMASDESNGLGRLSECVSCTVSEKRNGEYTATFELPITAKLYSDIEVGSLVKIKPNDDSDSQIFRVNDISRAINGICTYNLNHLTYDLSKVVVTPFTAKGATNACIELKAHSVTAIPFEIVSDGLNEDSEFTVTEPSSLRSLLGGQEGSLLDVFGGEYEWNNLQAILHLHRGVDNNVSIKYGKNLTDLTHDSSIDSTYTAVYPYAKKMDQEVVEGTLHTIQAVDNPKVKAMDFSTYFDQDEEITSEKVDSKCEAYINANDLTVPTVNIQVAFQPLWKTDEYKDIAPLEYVSLCDTVHVKYTKLGVEASSKVISYQYNVLKEQYDSIELGDTKNSLADTIANQSSDLQATKNETSGKISQVQQEIIDSTNNIRGGNGGYVVLDKDENGVNRQILIMDTASISTATNVIRMNKNGIGFSDTGANGVFNSAWNINGTFDASQINVVNLVASMFKGSTIDLGGLDNQSGVLKLRNEQNDVIGTLTKNGLTMYGSDGSKITMDKATGFVIYDSNDSILFQAVKGNVEAQNLTAKNFLIVDTGTYKSRFQKFGNTEDSNQIGCFWIES